MMPEPAGPNGSVPNGGGAPSDTQFWRTRVVEGVPPARIARGVQAMVRPELARNGPSVNVGGDGKIAFGYSSVTENDPKFATSSTRTSMFIGEPTFPLIAEGTGQTAIAICGPQEPAGAMPVGVGVADRIWVGVGVIVGVRV